MKKDIHRDLPERLIRKAVQFLRTHKELLLVCGGTAVLFYFGSTVVKITICAGIAYLIVKIGKLVYKVRLMI